MLKIRNTKRSSVIVNLTKWVKVKELKDTKKLKGYNIILYSSLQTEI